MLFLLLFALCTGTVSAAKKSKPKLSKSSIVLGVGDSTTIKLKKKRKKLDGYHQIRRLYPEKGQHERCLFSWDILQTYILSMTEFIEERRRTIIYCQYY